MSRPLTDAATIRKRTKLSVDPIIDCLNAVLDNVRVGNMFVEFPMKTQLQLPMKTVDGESFGYVDTTVPKLLMNEEVRQAFERELALKKYSFEKQEVAFCSFTNCGSYKCSCPKTFFYIIKW